MSQQCHSSCVLVLGPKKHSSGTRMGPFLMQITLLAQCGGHMSQQSSGSLGVFGVPTGDRVGVSGSRRRLIHSDQILVSQPITQQSLSRAPWGQAQRSAGRRPPMLLQIKKPPPCPTLQITRSLSSGVHLGVARCCPSACVWAGCPCPYPVCMGASMGGCQ